MLWRTALTQAKQTVQFPWQTLLVTCHYAFQMSNYNMARPYSLNCTVHFTQIYMDWHIQWTHKKYLWCSPACLTHTRSDCDVIYSCWTIGFTSLFWDSLLYFWILHVYYGIGRIPLSLLQMARPHVVHPVDHVHLWETSFQSDTHTHVQTGWGNWTCGWV